MTDYRLFVGLSAPPSPTHTICRERISFSANQHRLNPICARVCCVHRSVLLSGRAIPTPDNLTQINGILTYARELNRGQGLVRKTASFSEFSLCLSRACLSKMIVLMYKWLKNAVFRRELRSGSG